MAEAKNAAIIELQQWDAIAITQISGNRNCAICRNEHTVPCLNIARNQQEKECPISWGECGHGFHLHCIDEWLKAQSTCPIDSKDWKPTKVERNILN